MNQVRRAWYVLRQQGVKALAARVAVRFYPRVLDRSSLVSREDTITADWRTPKPGLAPAQVASKLRTAWIMPPPGPNSGGHQNIFRFLKVLEDAGHEVRIYIHSVGRMPTAKDVSDLVSTSSSYSKVKASIELYPSSGVGDDIDALFATSWETAYVSFNDPTEARRFYFVQDFEPLFFPMSTEAVLAQNTYRFGFFGVTAGSWLETKLARDFGMRTASFDFGSDPEYYHPIDGAQRDSVFFYARPATPRRGFELGTMALELFARERPDVPIITGGQSLRHYQLPFAHEDLGHVEVADLGRIYNRCAAALVLSLSNLSLLPLELLASGTIPVVNAGENNQLVSSNPFIEYCDPQPSALADRLRAVIERPDRDEHALRAAASAHLASWDVSGRQFLAAIERGMRD